MNSEKEQDRWFDRISQHLSGIGLIAGGELVVLGLLYDRTVHYLPHEKVILTAIAVGIGIQAWLWIRQLMNDRYISYERYKASVYERQINEKDFQKFHDGEPRTNTGLFTHHYQNAFSKQHDNTKEGLWLDRSVLVTVVLLLLMFLLELWK